MRPGGLIGDPTDPAPPLPPQAPLALPEEGVFQVEEVAGLGAGLVYLSHDADVVALSGGGHTRAVRPQTASGGQGADKPGPPRPDLQPPESTRNSISIWVTAVPTASYKYTAKTGAGPPPRPKLGQGPPLCQAADPSPPQLFRVPARDAKGRDITRSRLV